MGKVAFMTFVMKVITFKATMLMIQSVLPLSNVLANETDNAMPETCFGKHILRPLWLTGALSGQQFEQLTDAMGMECGLAGHQMRNDSQPLSSTFPINLCQLR